ncbi:hypothetical protein SprV_0200819500 [Sparganum proliferum]
MVSSSGAWAAAPSGRMYHVQVIPSVNNLPDVTTWLHTHSDEDIANLAANSMVNCFRRQLKTALRATEDPANWSNNLLLVLLGVRSALKSDLDRSAAEMVLSTTLRLPGEMVIPTSRGADERPNNFVHRLPSLSPAPPLTPPAESYAKEGLVNCTHVFIRRDLVCKPLEPPYERPFRVLSSNVKTCRIPRGDKEDVISIDLVKAAVAEESPDLPQGVDDQTEVVEDGDEEIHALLHVHFRGGVEGAVIGEEKFMDGGCGYTRLEVYPPLIEGVAVRPVRDADPGRLSRDDEAMVVPPVSTRNRLCHQYVPLVSPPDEDIVQQVPLSRSTMHPGGLHSHRKVEEGVRQDESMFCAGSKKEQAIVVGAV